jgi:NAD-dependent dihydropyrimidine dehydrogenase PreA subunit
MKYMKNTVTLEYYPEKCTGCGRCTEVCPHAVFSMDKKRAVLQDRDACMECGACAKNCDYAAIKVTAGVGCAAAIINGMLTGKEPSCDCGC